MSKENEIKLAKWLEYAREKLKKENSEGRFDENKNWEKQSLEILNAAYGWQLQDLNEDYLNHPAIDLGDRDLMVGVQVSSNCEIGKINDMLSKLKSPVKGVPVYKRYNKIFFSLSDIKKLNPIMPQHSLIFRKILRMK